jgi:hypothetical protein
MSCARRAASALPLALSVAGATPSPSRSFSNIVQHLHHGPLQKGPFLLLVVPFALSDPVFVRLILHHDVFLQRSLRTPAQMLHRHIQPVRVSFFVHLPVVGQCLFLQPVQPPGSEAQLLDACFGAQRPDHAGCHIARHPQLLFPPGAGAAQHRHPEIRIHALRHPAAPQSKAPVRRGHPPFVYCHGHIQTLLPQLFRPGQNLVQPRRANAEALVQRDEDAPPRHLRRPLPRQIKLCREAHLVFLHTLFVVFPEPYNSEGSFTLEVRPTEENLSLLREGRWLVRTDAAVKIPMRICHRSNENEDANLVVTGYPATWIYTKRVSISAIKNENAETAMLALARSAAPWPRLEVAEAKGFDTKFENQTSGAALFDYFKTVGSACDLGFRVVLMGKNSAKKLMFEVWRPTADPNNRFSPRWGSLREAAWAFGDGSYANVALVLGAGEGSSRAMVWAGDTEAEGAERREMIVDARDIQPEDGETNTSDSYLKKLADRGASKLLEQLRTGSIEMTLDADGLEPGDVCCCFLPDLGYKATVRVADIIIQSQTDGTTRTARLGTPVWHKI